MIEVEKKVALKEEDLKTIEKLGTFLGSRILTDTYFDTSDFRYTTNDIWLRERECKFELKVGIKGACGGIERYEEILDEDEIIQKLGLEKDKDISRALAKEKIFPYATFQTVRRKYQIEKFVLDLDLAYFDDFIYRIAEIELMVSSESKIPWAENSINAFIEQIGFDKNKPVKAKLMEYLSQKNPTHYQALIASGIAQDYSELENVGGTRSGDSEL
jgi:adenylate cyclase class IV